jgi:hypothetical protein
LGFDPSLRWRGARASGEVTYFRNDIRDFVFTAPLTPEDFEERLGEFADRFPEQGAVVRRKKAARKKSSRSSSTCERMLSLRQSLERSEKRQQCDAIGVA